jgi:hypothetical protein
LLLATIALENDILDMINYEDIIEDFILRNTGRMIYPIVQQMVSIIPSFFHSSLNG